MTYTIVKIKSSYKDTITLLLKELIGFNIEVVEKTNYIILKHNFSNIDDIKSLIISFSSEEMINVFCYTTMTSNPELELNLCLKIFDKYNNGFYTLKELLINDLALFNKKEVLDLILNSTGIGEEFIKEYVKYDLNISKASKEMFIHRNTMNYKLDKLKELSGFDLRTFKDAYILYSLIDNK